MHNSVNVILSQDSELHRVYAKRLLYLNTHEVLYTWKMVVILTDIVVFLIKILIDATGSIGILFYFYYFLCEPCTSAYVLLSNRPCESSVTSKAKRKHII